MLPSEGRVREVDTSTRRPEAHEDAGHRPRRLLPGEEPEDPDLVVSVVVVALAGVLTAASGLLLVDPMVQAPPDDASGTIRTVLLVQNVGTVVLTLVLWTLFTGVFYGVSSLFEGRGRSSGPWPWPGGGTSRRSSLASCPSPRRTWRSSGSVPRPWA